MECKTAPHAEGLRRRSVARRVLTPVAISPTPTAVLWTSREPVNGSDPLAKGRPVAPTAPAGRADAGGRVGAAAGTGPGHGVPRAARGLAVMRLRDGRDHRRGGATGGRGVRRRRSTEPHLGLAAGALAAAAEGLGGRAARPPTPPRRCWPRSADRHSAPGRRHDRDRVSGRSEGENQAEDGEEAAHQPTQTCQCARGHAPTTKPAGERGQSCVRVLGGAPDPHESTHCP